MAKLTEDELVEELEADEVYGDSIEGGLREFNNTFYEEGTQGIGCVLPTRPAITYDTCDECEE